MCTSKSHTEIVLEVNVRSAGPVEATRNPELYKKCCLDKTPWEHKHRAFITVEV